MKNGRNCIFSALYKIHMMCWGPGCPQFLPPKFQLCLQERAKSLQDFYFLTKSTHEVVSLSPPDAMFPLNKGPTLGVSLLQPHPTVGTLSKKIIAKLFSFILVFSCEIFEKIRIFDF